MPLARNTLGPQGGPARCSSNELVTTHQFSYLRKAYLPLTARQMSNVAKKNLVLQSKADYAPSITMGTTAALPSPDMLAANRAPRGHDGWNANADGCVRPVSNARTKPMRCATRTGVCTVW